MKFSKEYITLAIPFLIIGLILIIILPNELKFLGIIVGLLFQFFYNLSGSVFHIFFFSEFS